MASAWKTYEEVATYLLGEIAAELGLERVEGKQSVRGTRSGTEYEIDAKGVRSGNEGFVIIECRRNSTRAETQEKLGGLAFRIIDTGASGGIHVSPIGLQLGAKKVAASERILEVRLDKDCTPQQFCLRFPNKLFVGIHESARAEDTATAVHIRTCCNCGARFEVQVNEETCENCRVDA